MDIPNYVYRNLSRFKNCLMPTKLVEEYGIEYLEKELSCKIRKSQQCYSNEYGKSETTVSYIGEIE